MKVRAPHVRRTSSALLPAAVAWLFLVAVPVTASPIKLSDQSMAANPGPVSPAPASAPSAGTTSVDITLWKYICPSYDVVPANANPTNEDATGGHGGELDTSYQTATANPVTDVPQECAPQPGWVFTLTAGNVGPVIAEPSTGADGSVVVTLEGADADLVRNGTWNTGVVVVEQLAAGYDFGALRCYTDVLNGDNLEGIYGWNGEDPIACLAYNVAPTPEPTPAPTPTPTPTRAPTPAPNPAASSPPAGVQEPAPTAAAGQVPGEVVPGPGDVLTPGRAAVPGPGGVLFPGGVPGPDADAGGDADDSPDGPGTAVDSPAPSDPPAGIVTPGAGTGGAGTGGAGTGGSGSGGSGPRVDSPAGPEQVSAQDPNAAGPFGNDPLGQLVLLTAAVSTGTTLALAFLAFGRRRRNDEYDDEALAAAAATPYGMPVAVTAPMPRFDPGTGGTDVDLPRWRRPSLMAARKSDPVRGFDAPARLTFEPSAAGVDGERRRVRYRLVRLLDSPDELTGSTVDTVDAGDEVAIVETSGLYRRVVTPDGRTGWLHKMTLGEVIEAAPPDGDEGLDPDVLMAYLAARGRG